MLGTFSWVSSYWVGIEYSPVKVTYGGCSQWPLGSSERLGLAQGAGCEGENNPRGFLKLWEVSAPRFRLGKPSFQETQTSPRVDIRDSGGNSGWRLGGLPGCGRMAAGLGCQRTALRCGDAVVNSHAQATPAHSAGNTGN